MPDMVYKTAPKLAKWLEKNGPEGLTAFAIPNHYCRRLQASNRIERAVQQELKRHTVKRRVRPAILPLEGPLFLPDFQMRNRCCAS